MSLWDNLVNKKYYVTGGVGSGETSEGFGPNYSLRNASYCESCSSCGDIFFQWKMNLAYHDAKYADLYEETMYNALLGSTDLEGKHFYYTNPLDANEPRTAWHVCPCCVGNISRTLLMLPTWLYARTATASTLIFSSEALLRSRTLAALTSKWCRRQITPGTGKSRSPSIRRSTKGSACECESPSAPPALFMRALLRSKA